MMIEAEHMCMSLRGVTKPGALTVTTHFTGAFRTDANEQVRFMSMLRWAKVSAPRVFHARQQCTLSLKQRKALPSRRHGATPACSPPAMPLPTRLQPPPDGAGGDGQTT